MPHLLSDVCSREDAPVPLSRMMPPAAGDRHAYHLPEPPSEFPAR
ncbi:hypothetical protein ACNKHS_18345 [Shigella flexneri]